VRIIGGEWRRRRLRFPAARDLRPSPDAVRETLFNWLQSDLPGARCLDLFAGSGAIGFEAVSRGAASAVLVESDAAVARQLESSRRMLRAEDRVEVFHGPVKQFFRSGVAGFDLVFMDPPFRGGLLEETCQMLWDHYPFSSRALLYIESTATNGPLPIPADWHIIRQQDRGAVRSTLIKPSNVTHAL
jgi:16S rRNA (guanine966-N2)-methyltransferase